MTEREWEIAQLNLTAALLDAVDRLPVGHRSIVIYRDAGGALHVSGPNHDALLDAILAVREAEAKLPEETTH